MLRMNDEVCNGEMRIKGLGITIIMVMMKLAELKLALNKWNMCKCDTFVVCGICYSSLLALHAIE